MQPHNIIGLVGRKGSGKGTVAKLLADRYGAAVFRFSDPLRDILRRLHLPIDREHLVAASEMLREHFGEDILQHTLLRDVKQTPSSLVVLDGVRRVEELPALRASGSFHLIAIDAPLAARYERSANRGENHGEQAMTMAAFEKTETASTETTIAAVEAVADFRLANTGTYEELIAGLDALMARLGK
jgi:dephospho-CoA kinase